MLIYIAGTLAIVTQIQQLKRNKKEKKIATVPQTQKKKTTKHPFGNKQALSAGRSTERLPAKKH